MAQHALCILHRPLRLTQRGNRSPDHLKRQFRQAQNLGQLVKHLLAVAVRV